MADAERVEVPVTSDPIRRLGADHLLRALRGALAWLQANQDSVNDLNVFPVPDGDTGSNMYLTLRSAVEEAQRVGATSAAGVMAAAAHGSLLGARGNSGVILSQILRGAAQAMEGHETVDAAIVGASLRSAASVAYKAVIKPTEGTILTVIRAAAEAAESAAQTGDVGVVLDTAVRHAHEAVEKTTEQLAVLRDAGVVDAGGFGLAVILEGFSRALADGGMGEPVATRVRVTEPRVREPAVSSGEREDRGRRGAAAVAERDDGWGYCTEFLMHGPGLDPDALRQELGECGESALVVGDAEVVRVHIHTDDPAALIGLAARRARLSRLKVEDMSAQHHEILERADAPAQRKTLGVVAVAPGEGFSQILISLGCDHVVAGGQTMNPSIEDLLNGVRAVHADSVILLPNNPNVILTAQQIDALAGDVSVIVVPTRNLPQGISALVAVEPGADVAANARKMETAMTRVKAVETTRAVRDTVAGGRVIREGDVLGILDGEIVEVGDDDATVITAVLRRLDERADLVTVYRGLDIDASKGSEMVTALREAFPDCEFELQAGGQDHYPYVLSVE